MPNLVGIGLSQVPTNSMLGGLAYQSPDHASIKDLDLKNLSQINSEISDTAVDVFVYDTRKDSDGGAWRKRTQHTSWYNETLGTATRGTRKEFPAVAVIVAESNPNKVTIYDGDDPDLPMWMVFNASTNTNANFLTVAGQPLSSIFMLNGELGIGFPSGNQWGLNRVNFLSDSQAWYWTSATIYKQVKNSIAERNLQNGYYNTGSGISALANARVNDIAMTVLPNAPIDSATGLPVPTIAVATNGGVSVIKDDGTVFDVIDSNGARICYDVSFTKDHKIMHTGDLGAGSTHAGNVFVTNILTADRAEYDNNDDLYRWYSTSANYPRINGGNTFNTRVLDPIDVGGDYYAMADVGISLIEDGTSSSVSNTDGMVAYITSDYNSGYQHGDIKGAFLSDTDTTNISGGNIVTNGDAWTGAQSSTSSTPPTGWTGGNAAQFKTHSGGDGSYIRLVNAGSSQGGPNSYMYQAITTVPGRKYKISLTQYHHATISVYYRVGTSINGNQLTYRNWTSSSSNTPRDQHDTFTATGTTTYLTLGITSGTNNYDTGWDNVVITEVDEDRSVNANGLHSYGTITKSAVATGADLVAYSGFSNSNYFEQPYSSDLDMGTGEFCVMGWFKASSSPTTAHRLYRRGVYNGSWSGGIYSGFMNANNTMGFNITPNGYSTIYVATSSGTYQDGNWHHLVHLRNSNGMYQYIDGRLDGSSSSSGVQTTNLDNSTATLVLGGDQNTSATTFWSIGDMALWRVSKSAPSPEQIKKIYEDEKFLFQENAKCTLYGSSDAVTALAYDEDTELLHVGTSSGRSDFQGLRRINNTTTAVTTAISASDDLIAEQ